MQQPVPNTEAEPEWMDVFTGSIQAWHFDELVRRADQDAA